jgi:ankyrin repeat protein
MHQIKTSVLVLFAVALYFSITPKAAESKQQEILDAIIRRDVKKVKDLLKNGVPGTFEDAATGVTPLILAVAQRDEEIIKLLLDHGAKADHRTTHGDTALHSAAYNAPESVLKVLLKSKPDINVTNAAGGTPLMAASISGNRPAIKMLVTNHADVNAKAADGSTALILAAKVEGKKIESVLDLLKAKADPNSRDRENRNALYYAVRNGDKEIVNALLQHGAKITHGDLKDLQTWEAARKARDKAVLTLLEEAANNNKP